jgi:hypothetical protein
MTQTLYALLEISRPRILKTLLPEENFEGDRFMVFPKVDVVKKKKNVRCTIPKLDNATPLYSACSRLFGHTTTNEGVPCDRGLKN